jgi:cytochrome c oxidase assembly protein subunit 15
MTWLLVVLGGVVCITGSSRGCPDWPACYGQLVPPLRLDSMLEYTHRVLALLTSLLIVASAIVGWRNARSIRWVAWPPVIAIAFLVAVVVFGAMVVLRGLEPGLAVLDLGSALLVLALVLAATVVAFFGYKDPALPDRLSFQDPFARLALWTLVAVFVVLVSGVLVAEDGSMVRCLGWPLFGGRLDLSEARGWLQGVRRLAGGLAGVLILLVLVQAWRVHEQQWAIRSVATAVGMAFLVETAIGALLWMHGFSVGLYVVYAAAATALWTLLVVLVVWAGLLSSGPTRGGITPVSRP